jgi:hypothetical protein
MSDLQRCTRAAVLLLSAWTCGCRPNADAEAVRSPGEPVNTGLAAPTPADDASQVVALGRQYAAAVAAGDVAAARSLVHTPTANHERLADAVTRQFHAYHRVRTAAAERLGEAVARRLPQNDAGEFFVDRMRARLDGDEGAVEWRDDYGPEGTPRDLAVVRVGGRWKVSLSEFVTQDNGRELASEVRSAAGEINAWTRDLRRIEAEIRSGKLGTFEAIRDAN